MDIDQDYIKDFEENEEAYNKFYNQETKRIKLFYLYVNKNNEVYNIKIDNEIIENSCLTKERLLYLIKKNQFYLVNNHRLVSLLKYNIDFEHIELKNFIYSKEDESSIDNYLSSVKILNSIYFKDTVGVLQDLNSVFLIFTNNIQTLNNTTKRINIKTNKSRTRRVK
jgi:hypothetical protein